MSCQSCGAPLTPGSTFCGRCGKPATAPAQGAFKRPGIVTLLATLHFFGGGLSLLFAVAVVLSAAMGKPKDATLLFAMGAIYALIGVLSLATGIGLWQLKRWGRILQIVLACLGLLGIPCGTVISIAILIYMFKPGVQILFSERSPRSLRPEELALVASLGEWSTAAVVIGAAVAVLVLVAVVGIIAAIAIPSLLRARVSANESATIGDLRTVISAEMVYASTNGGLYDTLECLRAPQGCIPNYSATSPSFLDPALATARQKGGYNRTLHLGPPAAPEVLAGGQVSPSSVTTFAYVAVPITFGQTGVRSFCGDSTGRICFTRDGTAPTVEGGLCDMSCEAVR